MKLLGVHIDAYGHFQDVQFDRLDAPVVCLSGPNEAGKSTLFSFIRSMLYGIYPTDPTANPYVPHDGRTLQGRLRYRLQDGSEGEISRSLRNTPEGEWIRGGGLFEHPEAIRNRTIPFVDHVSMRVFENVYSLSLADLTVFDPRTFQEVQDGLLGGLNARHLRPAPEVIAELDAEAKRHWRADRMGKPLAAALAADRTRLTDELREAEARATQRRRLEAREAELAAEIEAAKTASADIRRRLTEARAFAEIQADEQEVGRLRAIASEADGLADIPDPPGREVEALRQRRSELTSELAEIDGSIKTVAVVPERETDAANAILQREEEVRRALTAYDSARRAYASAATAIAELTDRRTEFEAEARALLSWPGPFQSGEDASDSVALLDGDRLTALVRELQEDRRFAASLVSRLARSAGRRRIAAYVAVVLVLLGSVGFGTPVSHLLTGGVIGTALALMWWLAEKWGARRTQKRLVDCQRRIRLTESDVAETAGGIPVRGDIDDPARLAAFVAAARDLIQRRSVCDRIRDEFLSCGRQLDMLDRELHDEAEAGRCEPEENYFSRIEARLARALGDCRESLRTSETTRLKRADLEARRGRLAARLREVDDKRSALERRLADFGDGRVGDGLDRLRRCRDGSRRAELIAERIDARKANSPGGPVGDESAEDLESGLAGVETDLDRLHAEVASVRRGLGRLDPMRGVEDVESELARVEQRLEDVLETHDRLRLLEGIVRLADQRFRECHQPDVIRRTNDYLQRITAGRYRAVLVDEDDRSLRVVRNGESKPRPVASAVSQGTRDQVYLALRLALADHIDSGRELLPLFLDEIFVTWDLDRRLRAYQIIRDLADRRQVFLLTCHPILEEEAAVHLDATTVRVDSTDHSFDRATAPVAGS